MNSLPKILVSEGGCETLAMTCSALGASADVDRLHVAKFGIIRIAHFAEFVMYILLGDGLCVEPSVNIIFGRQLTVELCVFWFWFNMNNAIIQLTSNWPCRPFISCYGVNNSCAAKERIKEEGGAS